MNAATRGDRAKARLCQPELAAVARRGRLAYVAVETAAGPHVTPVLFTAAAERVWFVVDRRTLKARTLARRPQVGVLIDAGSDALLLRGRATILDPLRPAGLASRWSELVRTPLAVPGYAAQNTRELAALARDAGRRPGRVRPDTHLMVSVAPASVALVAPPPLDSEARSANSSLDPLLAGVPAEVAAAARRAGDAVLGWSTADGPLALPAAWDPSRSRAALAWPEWAPVPRARQERPASLCFDVSDGPGPMAKAGLLLRGRGRVTGGGEVVLVPNRATYWRGFDSATAQAAA